MAIEIDLSKYVAVAAQVWVEENSPLEWDKIPREHQFNIMEALMPVVVAVVTEYRDDHPASDNDWLKEAFG